MKTPKIISPLMQRGVIFLGLFVLISGLNGSRIIGGDIMFRDGFAIYGGVGKAAIFGLIAFVLLVRHRGSAVTMRPWQPMLLAWMALALLFCIGAWVSVTSLLAGDRTTQNLLFAHGGLLASVACAAIGCFGPKNIQLLWRTYSSEMLVAAAIAGGFYVFLLGVYSLWQPLASIVLVGVHSLLGFAGIAAEHIPPYTLVTEKFGVTIAEYCSGIESIALFSGLYIIVGLLERGRLNLSRYLWVFPLALIVLFGLNILRVFGLIVAGYYINIEIAFSLFHTYAGMIFFILYSALFWAVAYKYLIKKAQVKPAYT